MATGAIEFVAARTWPHYDGSVDRIFAGYYGLQFVDAGGVKLTIDDRNYTLEGQWVWCTYPGPHFLYRPSENYGFWSHHYVTFRGARMDEWVAEGLLPFAPQQVPIALELGPRMDNLCALVDSGDRPSLLRAINELERIILDLAASRADMGARPLWLRTVLAQLNSAIDRSPDYAALAAGHGMSVSTLRRHFRALMGVPIHTYVLQKRIAAACEVLTQTDLPLKAIADHLGYQDVCFFSRQFRLSIGLSPGRFREAARRPSPAAGLGRQ